MDNERDWSESEPWTETRDPLNLYHRIAESDIDDLLREMRGAAGEEDEYGRDEDEGEGSDGEVRPASDGRQSTTLSVAQPTSQTVFDIQGAYDHIVDPHDGYTPPMHNTPAPYGVPPLSPSRTTNKKNYVASLVSEKPIDSHTVALPDHARLKRAEQAAAQSAREREEEEIKEEARVREKERLLTEKRLRQMEDGLRRERIRKEWANEKEIRERRQEVKRKERETKKEYERVAQEIKRREAEKQKATAARLTQEKAETKGRIRKEKKLEAHRKASDKAAEPTSKGKQTAKAASIVG
ncbi:hypothetical protein QFC20_005353 [Naganishia adeliensis]|uniref:Uncharacterized protein n=1 Tax=Naganishia adeliensis TaxID=92952 RepID=A0ACC2VP15_9TREE|nr:hypothetical protein QFC20_005353 [Naganishia adeliensis]